MLLPCRRIVDVLASEGLDDINDDPQKAERALNIISQMLRTL